MCTGGPGIPNLGALYHPHEPAICGSDVWDYPLMELPVSPSESLVSAWLRLIKARTSSRLKIVALLTRRLFLDRRSMFPSPHLSVTQPAELRNRTLPHMDRATAGFFSWQQQGQQHPLLFSHSPFQFGPGNAAGELAEQNLLFSVNREKQAPPEGGSAAMTTNGPLVPLAKPPRYALLHTKGTSACPIPLPTVIVSGLEELFSRLKRW